jgi:hypothetical protein
VLTETKNFDDFVRGAHIKDCGVIWPRYDIFDPEFKRILIRTTILEYAIELEEKLTLTLRKVNIQFISHMNVLQNKEIVTLYCLQQAQRCS